MPSDMFPIYVSHSMLSSSGCDTKLLLRHHHRLQPPGERNYLTAGKAAHEAVAAYFRSTAAGHEMEEALAVFEREYRAYSDEHILVGDRLRWENLHVILSVWFRDYHTQAMPFEILRDLVEIDFQLPLTDMCICGNAAVIHPIADNGFRCDAFQPRYIYHGRIDAIVRALKGDRLYVLDLKTGASIRPRGGFDPLDKYHLDAQMSGYVWAAQQTLNMPIVGVYIPAIEFSLLPEDADKLCRTHKPLKQYECRELHVNHRMRRFDRSEQQIKRWRLDAYGLAAQFASKRSLYPHKESLRFAGMQGTFTGGCYNCDYQKWCISGRPVEYLDKIFEPRPQRLPN